MRSPLEISASYATRKGCQTCTLASGAEPGRATGSVVASWLIMTSGSDRAPCWSELAAVLRVHVAEDPARSLARPRDRLEALGFRREHRRDLR
jgi:hypothetical protein